MTPEEKKRQRDAIAAEKAAQKKAAADKKLKENVDEPNDTPQT